MWWDENDGEWVWEEDGIRIKFVTYVVGRK